MVGGNLFVLCCALVIAVVAGGGAPAQCLANAPGQVPFSVCKSGLCGPDHVCLANTYGGACSCDAECFSDHCRDGVCQKTRKGGSCKVNEDCSSNNCDTSCWKCQANNAGGTCGCDADCSTDNCDTTTFTCQKNGNSGDCKVDGDCFSGKCKHSCKCAASAPGEACLCDYDCGSGGACLLVTNNGVTRGVCYLKPDACCQSDNQCGTQFCARTAESSGVLVCQESGRHGPCASDDDCAADLYCVRHDNDDHLGTCHVNPCNVHPCSSDATCDTSGADFTCTCNNGLEGPGLQGASADQPGCVKPAVPAPLPVSPLPAQATPVVGAIGSTCYNDFECGTLFCDIVGAGPGQCAVKHNHGPCWTNGDCNPDSFCNVKAHVFDHENPHYPEHGQCQENRCVDNKAGCDVGTTCEPVDNDRAVCHCPALSFGSGITHGDKKGCVNPCDAPNNGGCGTDGECLPVNREKVDCNCHPGFYFSKKSGCHNPCSVDNGGCHIFELCTANGPSRDDVTCQCERDGFIKNDHGHCIVDPCYNKCTNGAQGCTVIDDFTNFQCYCTQTGFDLNSAGVCVQNRCEVNKICSPLAVCTFIALGGQTSGDIYANCACPWGYTGNGVGPTGCVAAVCPALVAADVAAIQHAVVGNCGSNTLITGEYCVLGCESGFTPSIDPRGQCVGDTATTSKINFRTFSCKSSKHHHGDHDDDHLSSNDAWLCSVTSCVPRAPSLGWKNKDLGKLAIHWNPLGPSVNGLTIWVNGNMKATVTNPAFATSAEMNGFIRGQTYEISLHATTSEDTFIGDVLIVNF